MRKPLASGVLIAAALTLTTSGARTQGRPGVQGPRAPALLQDYLAFTVTAPPASLELDPFYKKYTDAHGVPVVSSAKVPDAALLMARDIVQFMLANRPDLRRSSSARSGSSPSWRRPRSPTTSRSTASTACSRR